MESYSEEIDIEMAKKEKLQKDNVMMVEELENKNK